MNAQTGHSKPTYLKNKLAVGITALVSLAALVVPFGAASADSYSGMRNTGYQSNGYASSSYSRSTTYSSSYTTRSTYSNSYRNQYGNYATYPVQHSSYSSQHSQHYSTYRWVYDPCLHRWVLIHYNPYSRCWEYCDSGQRYVGQVY